MISHILTLLTLNNINCPSVLNTNGPSEWWKRLSRMVEMAQQNDGNGSADGVRYRFKYSFKKLLRQLLDECYKSESQSESHSESLHSESLHWFLGSSQSGSWWGVKSLMSQSQPEHSLEGECVQVLKPKPELRAKARIESQNQSWEPKPELRAKTRVESQSQNWEPKPDMTIVGRAQMRAESRAKSGVWKGEVLSLSAKGKTNEWMLGQRKLRFSCKLSPKFQVFLRL